MAHKVLQKAVDVVKGPQFEFCSFVPPLRGSLKENYLQSGPECVSQRSGGLCNEVGQAAKSVRWAQHSSVGLFLLSI